MAGPATNISDNGPVRPSRPASSYTLAEIGVDPARVDELATMAAADPCAGENPVPAGAAEMAAMYAAALDGRLR